MHYLVIKKWANKDKNLIMHDNTHYYALIEKGFLCHAFLAILFQFFF